MNHMINDYHNKNRRNLQMLGFVFALVFVYVAVIMFSSLDISKAEVERISLPQLYEIIEEGKVDTVNMDKKELTVYLTKEALADSKVIYKLDNPNDTSFKRDLMELGINVNEQEESMLLNVVVQCATYGLMFFILMKLVGKMTLTNDSSSFKPASKQKNKPVVSHYSFSDLSGIDEALEEVQEVVEYMKNPNKFVQMGIRVPKGVLLVGPPGTGKTLLAKAVAGEAGVPFYSVSGSDFQEKYVGVGALRVRELFAEARANAPAVIFIDEIDAIAKARSSSGNSSDERENTLNQLLVEMDGINSDTTPIFVLAATNRKDILDSAILRPKRFDRIVSVGYPDVEGRKGILKIYSKNKPLDSSVDLDRLAKITPQFSGADLENLMNESAWSAIRNSRRVITWDDIDAGITRVIVGAKKKRNLLTASDKQVVAYHEAGHAIITHFLAKQKIEKITIYPTDNALGYVLKTPRNELLVTKQKMFNDICVALGGRLAEKTMFGEENITNGASQDFKQASAIARQMILSYGMSDDFGVLTIEDTTEGWMKVSEETKNKAYAEVQKVLRQAEEVTQKALATYDKEFKLLAKTLLEKETIDGYCLNDLFESKMQVQKEFISEELEDCPAAVAVSVE